MDRLDHIITAYSPKLLLPEVREHFEQFGRIIKVYPWISKGSRIHYFIEFEKRLPDLTILKNASPGVSISILSEDTSSAKKFQELVSGVPPSSVSEGRKRTIEDSLEVDSTDGPPAGPCEGRKRPRKAKISNDFSNNEVVPGRNSYPRATTFNPARMSLLLGEQHWPQATSTQLNQFDFPSSLRDMTLAKFGTDVDPLKQKPSASLEIGAGDIASKFVATLQPKPEDPSNKNIIVSSVPEGWGDNIYLNKLHRELKFLRKQNDSNLSALRTAKSSQYEAHHALKEECEKGRTRQTQLDKLTQQIAQMEKTMVDMKKRLLYEFDARSIAEGRLAQYEYGTQKNREETIKDLCSNKSPITINK